MASGRPARHAAGRSGHGRNSGHRSGKRAERFVAMAANGSTTPADSVQFGVTDAGFIVKPLQAILSDAFSRVQQLFGPDVDLRSSSSIRKLLELTSLEDALSWMQLDDVYHSRFLASAAGSALDLLGSALGRDRQHLSTQGAAQLKLTAAAPANALFTLPPGTIVETAPPSPGADPIRFRLLAKLSLVKHNPPDGSEQATAAVAAIVPGPSGNIAANTLSRL